MNLYYAKKNFSNKFVYILLLLFGGVFITTGQVTSPNIHLLRDDDSLTVYVDSAEAVVLYGLQFVVINNQAQINKYDIGLYFPELRSEPAEPGSCYVLYLNENEPPLQSLCTNPRLVFKRALSQASVFWFDFVANRSLDIIIYQNANPLNPNQSCPAALPNCPIQWPPIVPPGEPVNVVGSGNVGNVQTALMNTILEQTGIRLWHEAGLKGLNQKIGILDRHFGGLAKFENDFSLSVSINPDHAKNEYDADNITLGTNALEVVHGIAPSADLFACRYEDFRDFADCVDWMIGAGVKVIDHSASLPDIVLDGRSVWSGKVDEAAARDILWIDAAGNFAKAHLVQDFQDNNGNGLHEFRRIQGYNEILNFQPIPNLSGTIMLAWGDDSRGRSANSIDLNLQIVDSDTGAILAASELPQASDDDTAFESVTFDMNQPFGVQIVDSSGGTDAQFALYVEFGSIPAVIEQSSIDSPSDSPNALTIGVLQGALVAPYSSRGPNSMGLSKPDMVAPGEIQLADNQTWFVGSSAAASVVTGFAALVWQAHPLFSRQEVSEFILYQSTLNDTYDRGIDTSYGVGYLYAPEPAVPATPVPVVVNPTPTQSSAIPVDPNAPPVAVVKAASANLRVGPRVDYEVKGFAYKGDVLPISGQAFDWYLVQAAGSSVWIAGDAVDVIPENASIPRVDRNLIPPLPPSLTPLPTPTFPATPVPNDHSPEIPGGVIATEIPRPPPPGNKVTPVTPSTPNLTETTAAQLTATQYANDLTATASFIAPILTQIAYEAHLTATVVTWTPSPTPTASETPNPNITPNNATRQFRAQGTQAGQIQLSATPVPTNALSAPPRVTTIPPSLTPSATLTAVPVQPSTCIVTPLESAGNPNLRAGPGEAYEAKGTFQAGTLVQANGQYNGWWRLNQNNWWVSQGVVAENDAGVCNALPQIQPPAPPITDTPMFTPTPTICAGCPPPQTQEPPQPSISISFAGAGDYNSTGRVGCSAFINVTVSNIGSVNGQFHVWNAYYPPEGDIWAPSTFSAGTSQYEIWFGADQPQYKSHSVWISSNIGGSNRLDGLSCNNLPW